MSLINYITQIQFDAGAISLLPAECHRVGITRPLIVTDRGVRAAGIIDVALSHFPDATVQLPIYDGTPSNPNEKAVREAVAMFKEFRCDGIIAIGGGSAIDLAKGVAVCATHDGPLKSFAVIEGGLARITPATAPVIAVPTTAGTGSEVGRGAILILDDGRKVGVISDGLWRAWRFIETATRDPKNLEGRINMMSASLQGALAFQKGLGCVHSLSHSLGGINPRLHHGTLNAIFLPAVIAFNRKAETVVAEHKMARIAQAIGLADESKIEEAIRNMTLALGLPTGLRELEVTEDMFAKIIQGALADHSHRTNPREACADDYLWILEASM